MNEKHLAEKKLNEISTGSYDMAGERNDFVFDLSKKFFLGFTVGAAIEYLVVTFA
jgi:hypothetical protein